MKNKIFDILFFFYTLLLLSTAVFYCIANFGKGLPRLYGFVMLLLCIGHCFSRFQLWRMPLAVLPSVLPQLPALFLYLNSGGVRFDWGLDGGYYRISWAQGVAVHGVLLLAGLLLMYCGFRFLLSQEDENGPPA